MKTIESQLVTFEASWYSITGHLYYFELR